MVPKTPVRPGDMLTRLCAVVLRHRRRIFAAWLLATVFGVLGLPHLLGSLTSPPSLVTGSESERAAEMQAYGIAALGHEQMLLVLHSPHLTNTDALFRAAIDAGMTALRREPGVAGVLLLPVAGDPKPPPALAAALQPLRGLPEDRHTAYVLVGVTGDNSERQDRVPAQHAVAHRAVVEASTGKVAAYVVGPPAFAQNAQQIQIADLARIELIAVPAAIVVLLLGLRAPVAALLPVVTAGAGVLATLGIFTLLAGVLAIDGTLLIGTSAVGLGAGVDYALFVVSRFREERGRGSTPEHAALASVATSGRTVVYSGLVVIVSIASLFLVRWPVLHQFAIGIAAVTCLIMAASLTLLPAALVALSARLEWRPGRRPVGLTPPEGRDRLAAWARHLMRHPWPYAIAVTGLLAVLSVPAAGLKLGVDMERQALAATQFGKGLAIVERDVPGFASGITVLVRRPDSAAAPDLSPMVAAVRADPDVAAVTKVDNGTDLTALMVIPRLTPDSPRLVELVHRIRADIVPSLAPAGHTVLVGGAGSIGADILDECARKLPWIVAAVLLLMFLLLAAVLRSVLIPLKAIAMNLLATGASFGLMVVLFQHGAAADAFAFVPTGGIWPQVPIMVFVLLFAISLDYEMFLVRRIQEEYRATGDNVGSVAAALQHTARPITLAAVIMAVAFGSLLLSNIVGLQAFGFAIATALIIDATLIRLILVPALMKIMGKWNWWFPWPGTESGVSVPAQAFPRRRGRTASTPASVRRP